MQRALIALNILTLVAVLFVAALVVDAKHQIFSALLLTENVMRGACKD